MPRAHLTPALLLAATLAAALAAHAPPARAEPVQGGPGGKPFTLACERNAYVTGVTVRSGAWIDAVTAECGILNPARTAFVPAAPRTVGPAGGPGGAERRTSCDPNQFLVSVKFGFTREGNQPKYVDYIELTCSPLGRGGNISRNCLDSGGNGCWDRHPQPGHYNGFGLVFTSVCGPTRFPDALLGRSGTYVDALALRCVPRPA